MEVQQQYEGQVQIVGVPGLSDPDAIRSFIDEEQVGSIVHLEDNGELWDRFGVSEQRTYVFINDDGSATVTGYGSLSDRVAELVAG